MREWNGRVVASGEIACTPGDVGLMKGGKMTDRPCLHRAPYSADEGSEFPRFLLTVERLESDTVQQFIEMEEDCSDSSGESDDNEEDLNALEEFDNEDATGWPQQDPYLLLHTFTKEHNFLFRMSYSDPLEVMTASSLRRHTKQPRCVPAPERHGVLQASLQGPCCSPRPDATRRRHLTPPQKPCDGP